MVALAYAPTSPAPAGEVAETDLAQAAAQFMALRAESDRLMEIELDLQSRAVSACPGARAPTADLEALHRRLGLPEVQAAWKRAMSAQEAVAARIERLAPTSVRDAALKHGVLLASHLTEEGDVMDPEAFFRAAKRFQRDLEQLAGTPGV
ncbi:MAG: hypothetical protein QME55_00500 [Brevundimonas sp.]|uniref:hypothetical protein n=1 Tax=Brevundimonas sp. TaxID=1871086 RepID=UPI0026047B45|nr:hypothetical protein [Brevundimonas sp.]MDI6623182.1 hypothetical protein [Brevundimonas sp.]MDQ7811213.1 hypothetical protein [Brevundimonas sp.]